MSNLHSLMRNSDHCLKFNSSEILIKSAQLAGSAVTLTFANVSPHYTPIPIKNIFPTCHLSNLYQENN